MRRKVLLLTLILIAVFVMANIASADVQGSGWYYGATYQNVGAGNARVVITAQSAYGQPNSTHTLTVDPLAAGATFTILPNGVAGTSNDFSPVLPAGFKGSIVTSSDEPLAAVVNVTNRPAGGFGVSGGTAAALYSGVDGAQADTSVSFPLAKNNFFGKTTTFYLQNAGGSAASIVVTFKFNNVNYVYNSPSLNPGQMIAVDPGLASGAPSGSTALGSMVATSTQPIAAVMLEHESAASVAKLLQASGGFTPPQLDQTVYCPVIKDEFFGRKTGLQVQNAHSATQNITITYQPGNKVSTANNVAPGASVNFLDDPNLTPGLYSAKVTGSAGPVAAIVNESQLPLPAGVTQTSTTYACKGASQATQKVSYPAFKEVFFGRSTGLQVQNVGSSTATNVVLTFQVQGGGTFTSVPQTIAAGAAKNFVDVRNMSIWSGAKMGASTVSGVVVTADQPIIAIINEASWSTSGANNGAGSFDKANAVGFNLP